MKRLSKVKNRIISISLAVALILSVGLTGCGQPDTLTMVSITGEDISVMKEGTASWVEAEVGMSLGPGYIIKSGNNSSAEITFLDGSTIELQAGTEIEVVLLNISTETDSSTIRLKQTIGSIIFRVTKIIDPASRYEVETPTGVVAVRGSAMQVYVIEDGTTWVCNLEGEIWAIAQGVELQIPEGQCCIIRPTEAPELIVTACNLTISSTTGGSVTTPGEGIFKYEEGTVVNLAAVAEEDYQFFKWTGEVDTIADVNSAETIIIMNGDYIITAEFEMIGWVRNPANGHYYKLTEETTWPNAEAQAEAWDGHLVTINDEAEELWLRSTFGVSESFWIGVNDIAIEGAWVWVSGEPVTWTNWNEGEPNDHLGIEDVALMNAGPWSETLYGWNDVPSTGLYPGIVEVPEKPYL